MRTLEDECALAEREPARRDEREPVLRLELERLETRAAKRVRTRDDDALDLGVPEAECYQSHGRVVREIARPYGSIGRDDRMHARVQQRDEHLGDGRART